MLAVSLQGTRTLHLDIASAQQAIDDLVRSIQDAVSDAKGPAD